MSPEWVPLGFTEWLARSGLLVLGLSLAWSIIGAHAGRRLAMTLTGVTACLSLPWAIHSSELFRWISLPHSWTPQSAQAIPPFNTPWAHLLMGIWLAGSAFLALRWLLGLHQLARWCRPSRISAPDTAHQQWRKTYHSLPIGARRGRRLKVCFVPGLHSPSVWQARRTWLLLPINARDWPESTRRRVLLHELGHVYRRDGWLMMVWRAMDLFHWWNPCWWRLRSQWELSLECAADDWVVQWCPGETRDYARMLVDLAGAQPTNPSLPALGGGRLESRIRRLLAPQAIRNPWHRIRCVAGWVSTGILSTWILVYPPCGAAKAPAEASANEVDRRLAAEPFPQRN